MLAKTKKFYKKFAATLKEKSLQQVIFKIDYENFKQVLLNAQQLPLPPDENIYINTALGKAIFYVQPFSDAKKTFIDFVADALYTREYFSPLVFLSDDDELLLYFMTHQIELPDILRDIQKYLQLYMPVTIDMQPYPFEKFREFIESRSKTFYEKYSPETNPVVTSVWEKLNDEISKISFSAYLNQRYTAYIHARFEVIYPGKPPAQTKGWRAERQKLGIPVPKLAGASPDLLAFFHHHIFVMEQYATPGCVVEEGDVVIDGGAFVGDTAIYFSEKVGKSGKVYAFEPIPTNVANLRETLKINNAEKNTEIVPYALSKKKQVLNFLSNHSVSSALDEKEQEKVGDSKELLSVNAIDLDSFIEENSIKKIDYLKADLEGADIDFLNGARETIKKFAPKCGLVVYHKPDDIVEIPKILLECQPDYKFYFRMEAEPILFATL